MRPSYDVPRNGQGSPNVEAMPPVVLLLLPRSRGLPIMSSPGTPQAGMRPTMYSFHLASAFAFN